MEKGGKPRAHGVKNRWKRGSEPRVSIYSNTIFNREGEKYLKVLLNEKSCLATFKYNKLLCFNH